MSKRIIPLLAVLASLFWSRAAEASHFRYGTISWTVPDPQTAPLTAAFTVTSAWRAGSANQTTALNFGDGAVNVATAGAAIGGGTDTVGNAYTVQQYTVAHVYPAAGIYTAFFQSSARIAGLANGAGASFRVETKVGLAAGNTGGPVSAAPAIIQMQVGGVRTYTFPAFDPDGDVVTCRFATTSEMWSSNLASDGPIPPASENMPVEPIGNKQPTLTNTPAGCVVTWDLTQAAPGKQYVLHLVLESTHGGQVSSTAVDLIIETVSAPPPTCDGSGTFITNINQVFSTPTTGTIAGGGTLLLSATNAPAGAVINPPSGTTGASPSTNSFTWTPTAAFSGTTQIVLMNYTNTANNITGTCFLTLQVPQCANFGMACSVGVGECNKAGTNVCAGPGITVCNATAGSPVPELCDGKDNDCDGATDNGSPGSGFVCASGLPGICSAGITACTGGALVCDPIIAPGSQMEICDGDDNDCDGVNDDGDPGGGVACASGLLGVCSAGTTACAQGAITCNASIAPGSQQETCDGLDNDCDGVTDDGNPGGGLACTSGLPGVCSAGTTACTAGAVTCNAGIAPGALPEICDGQDNDCDGAVDNGNPGGGIACVSGLPGVCSAGTTACTAGAVACNADITPGSQPEACDGLDNDCNGVADEGNPGSGVACVSGLPGVCSAGITACAAGAIACNASIAPGTLPEICDGQDNDCDGATDDGDPGGGVACASGLPGVCSAGTTACAAGAIACNAGILPGSLPETCDSKDNDCDGTVDDGFVLGAVCSVGVGTCTAAGVIACDAMGGASCNAIPGAPVPEVCSDFLDNDCNGTVNDGCLDADGDGLYDDYEVLIGTDPNDADSDDDGVIDGQEPSLADDSDGDGLINALDADSDGDGLFDGTELGKDCSNPATDPAKTACISDADLGATKTDPLDADTDDGSVKDGVEDANHNGKIDAGETDPNDPADDVPEGCMADSECGATNSGKVCDDVTHACIDGCRGMGGNGCPDDKVCTSKTAAIGTCTDGAGGNGGGTSSTGSTGGSGGVGGTGGTGGVGGSGGVGGAPEHVVPSGNGIFCSATPGSGDDEGASWLLGGAFAALVGARRRRRAA